MIKGCITLSVVISRHCQPYITMEHLSTVSAHCLMCIMVCSQIIIVFVGLKFWYITVYVLFFMTYIEGLVLLWKGCHTLYPIQPMFDLLYNTVDKHATASDQWFMCRKVSSHIIVV